MFVSFGKPAVALIHLGVGFVIGAFTPSVGRKIKSLFVKKTQEAKGVLTAEVNKIEADVKSGAEKAASKL